MPSSSVTPPKADREMLLLKAKENLDCAKSQVTHITNYINDLERYAADSIEFSELQGLKTKIDQARDLLMEANQNVMTTEKELKWAEQYVKGLLAAERKTVTFQLPIRAKAPADEAYPLFDSEP